MAGNRQELTYAINADTSKAKKQIADLFKSLDKVQKFSIDNFDIAPDLVNASRAAEELATHLRVATNVNTGQLNLAKFNQSIRDANTSLGDLISDLSLGGSAGQSAFEQMTAAIARTQVPLRQTNALLKDMATTLKNTIKWELSSSAVHGLESALGGAVSYAKNLNTSLTNIRIVTGQSVEDMARFTKEANAAAKALSTTTKSYADASLIYYQQGDSQELAAKKAAITIKAANSSFETSAKEMSEYLTSVWNSYQVGVDELERYVDIMANLGAKTATSLEEIATSMRKVAATSNTVGVSMEQVSSIIATVSSVTRESAESIGTSYKTIFARIGDLKLGKVDEDGVGLGQVSSQLDAIGVKILDETGNLREMGDIIMDLGTKWQTMNQAQKTAVAQVVAGKRQYTQLMALFENWDMFQTNMNIAENSEGALQNMADIYAESWEAASARVQASMEGIFSTLINDQGLIKLTNFTASFVDGIGSAIDSIGGLNGVLRLTGSILLKTFSKEAGSRIKEIGSSIKNIFVDPKKSHQNALNETRAELSSLDLNKAQINAQIDLIDAKNQLLAVEEYLTSAQKQSAQAALQGLEAQANKVKQVEDEYLELKRVMDSSQFSAKENYNKDIRNKIKSQNIFGGIKSIKAPEIQTLDSIVQAYKRIKTAQELVTTSSLKLDPSNLNDYKDKTRELQKEAQNLKYAIEELGVSINSISVEELQNLIDKDNWSTDDIKKLSDAFTELGNNATTDAGKMKSALEKLSKEIEALGAEATPTQQKLDALLQSLEQSDDPQILARSIQELTDEVIRLKRATDGFKDGVNPDKLGFNKLIEAVFDLGGGALDLINGGAAVGELIANWGDEATTTAQKMGSLLSSMMELGMGGVSIFQGLSALGMSNPWSVGIAVGVTALSAISGVVSGNKQKEIEEARSIQEKYRESGFKTSENTRKEIQANQDLLSSYNELLSVYDATKTNQAELIESAYALADAYEIVGGKALIAAGEYGEFNKQLLQAQKAWAAKNISDFDHSMHEIEQSVNENAGGYYDIQSQNLYGDFEKEFVKTLSTDQRYTYTMESAGLKLNAAWAENTKIGGWGGRADQVFANLYETFKQDAYQAILNPEGLMSVEEAAIQGIEKFVQTNAKADFKFDDKNLKALYYSSSPDAIGGFYGYEKFQEQFINAFQDVNDLKVSEAYNVFNTSGILREDNITQFLKAEDLGISEGVLDAKYFDQFEGLIDNETQGISWNKLDFDGKLNQYQKYRDEVVPAIKKKQSEVQAEMAKHAKDSDAYKALAEYYEYLNTALNDIELITGADSEIGKTFELYLSDKKARDIERAKAKNIESFLKNDNGQYRTFKNTTLSDFMSERVALEESLLQDAETYDTLAPYVENGQIIEQYRKEYNAAVNEIIAGMVQGTDLTSLFDIDNIIKQSVKPENQADVTSLLVEKGVETADEVSGLLLQVISGTWDESAKLLAGSIIDANKQGKKADQAVAEYEQFAAAGKLFKSGMSSQDRTEFSNVFFNGETSKEEIDRFINMSFEEREIYIENIIKEKEQAMISELDAAAQADAAVFKEAKTRAENARLNLGLESGEIDNLLAGYAWNDDKQGYYSTQNPEEVYTGKLADRQIELHEYENYVSQMKAAESQSILSYGEWQMAKATIEDTLSAMEKLQIVQSKIGVDLSNLPKKGTDAWKRLREEILKTGKDLEQLTEGQQIDAISDAQMDNLDAQIAEKEKELANAKSESEKAEIESTIAELRDEKDQVLVDTAKAYEALNNQAIAGISSEWEQANKLAEKKQQIAQTLSSAVDSGIISNEEAALVGYTAKQWAQYSIEVRAAIAAQKTLEGSKAVQEQLDKERTAVDNAIVYLETYETAIKNIFGDKDNPNSLSELLYKSLEAGTIDENGLKAFEEAYKEVIAEFGEGISSDKLIEQMSIRLGIDKSDLESQIAQVAGAGQDAVDSIFATMSQELKEKAQEAVDAWLSAFDTIAEARKILLEGGSLIDQLAGDPKKIQELFQNFDGTWEEFTKGIIEGTIKAEDLSTPEITESYLQDRYVAAGVATLTGSNEERRAAARKQLEAQNTTGEPISEEAVTAKVAQDYETAIKGLVEQGLIKMSDDQIKVDAVALAKGEHGMGDALLAVINEYLLQAQERINFSEQLRAEGNKREETAIAVQEAANTGNLVINANGVIQVDGETISSDTIGLTREDGKASSYEEYQQLQEAISRAQDAKYNGETWQSLNAKDKELLANYGINNFDQVDAAAINCANALAACADAAYQLAMASAKEQGYEYNATTGEYTKNGIAVTANQDPVVQAMEEARLHRDEMRIAAQDVPYNTFELKTESQDLDASEVDKYGDSLQKAALSADDLDDSLASNAEAADEVARVLLRAKKAVEEISESYDDWIKSAKDATKSQKETRKLAKEVKSTLNDLMDLQEDYFDLNNEKDLGFLTDPETIDMMKDVAEGVEGAEDKMISSLSRFKGEALGLSDEIIDAWTLMGQELNDLPAGTEIEIGSDARVSPEFHNALNTAIASLYDANGELAMGVNEANDILQSMGDGAGFDVEAVDGKAMIPGQVYYKPITEPMQMGEGTIPVIVGWEPITSPNGEFNGVAYKVTNKKGSSGGRVSGGSSGGGKGGGGGSSGGKKDKKELRKPEDETERYHKQNETLSRVAEELDKIDKLKQRAYGKNHVKQIENEIKALEKEVAAQQDLYDEAKKFQEQDKAKLLTIGAEFDENGNISNYDDVMKRITEQLNAAIDKWNNSAQSDADKEELEKSEKLFEEQKKWIEQYEETQKVANEAANAVLEARNKISALKLEKITYELEVKLEINERDLEILEYYIEKYSGTLMEQDDRYLNTMLKTGELVSNLQALDEQWVKLLNDKDLSEADFQKGASELVSQMLDNLAQLDKLGEELTQVYIDAVDMAMDEVDRLIGTMEHANSVIDQFMNIMDLTGRKLNRNTISSLLNSQLQVNMNEIETIKNTLDTLKQNRQKLLSQGDLDENGKEQLKKLNQEIQDMESQLVSTFEQTISGIYSIYEHQIEGIAEKIDDLFAGAATSLAHLQEQYGYFQEQQGQYVSTTKELYEVSKLNRDIENTLANTTSKASKEALKALQEKINKQSQLNQLTEYDIEMNQLQYELLLARIKLEETQNAKDTVRLTRDEDGNYAYRYTANQEKVEEAAQNYEDVLQKINDTTVSRTSEIEQQILQTINNYKERFMEIAMDYSLTEEERNALLEEEYQKFSQRMMYYQDEYYKVTGNLLTNQQTIAEHYGVNFGEITSGAAGNVNSSIASMMENMSKFKEEMHNIIFGDEGYKSAWKTLADTIERLSGLSGLTLDSIIDLVAGLVGESDDAAGEVGNVVNQLDSVLDALDPLTKAWKDHKEVLSDVFDYYEGLADQIAAVLKAMGKFGNETPSPDVPSDDKDKEKDKEQEEQKDKDKEQENNQNQQDQKEDKASIDKYMSGLTDKFDSEDIADLVVNDQDIVGGIIERVVNNSDLLNGLRQSIEEQTASILSFLDGYHATVVSGLMSQPQTIEQNITIEADFPNVSSSLEIEEAFESMAIRAQQFAQRKN